MTNEEKIVSILKQQAIKNFQEGPIIREFQFEHIAEMIVKQIPCNCIASANFSIFEKNHFKCNNCGKVYRELSLLTNPNTDSIIK